MPENLGYAGSGEDIDFAGHARKIAEQVQAIDERRTLEKQELDDMNTLDMKLYQDGNNQTTDEFVHNGADIIRSKMFAWNKELKAGQISPREYKSRMNNVKSYWGSLAETAQTYGDRLMQQIERQRAGESSITEVYSSGVLADLQNLEQKSVYVDDVTGGILLTNTDEYGRNTGEPIDIHHLNNPNNVIEAKVDVPETVGESVKNWAEFEQFTLGKRGASEKYTDARLNTAFENSVSELTYTMINNTPNAVASIIGDNGVAGVYTSGDNEYNIIVDMFTAGNEKDKEAKKQQQLDKLKEQLSYSDRTLTPKEEAAYLAEVDKYMIPVSRDANGTFVTSPTDFHKKLAKDRIRHEIEINLGHKEVKSSPWKPVYRAPTNTTKDDKNNRVAIEGYNATKLAFTGDFSGMNNTDFDYEFYREGDVVGGGRVKKDFVMVRNGKTGDKIAMVDNPKALAEFTYEGKTAAEGNEMWESANKFIGGAQSVSNNNDDPLGIN